MLNENSDNDDSSSDKEQFQLDEDLEIESDYESNKMVKPSKKPRETKLISMDIFSTSLNPRGVNKEKEKEKSSQIMDEISEELRSLDESFEARDLELEEDLESEEE